MAIEIAFEVLTDPDFLSRFDYKRRTQSVNGFGEAVVTESDLYGFGVVAPEGKNKLVRNEDYQTTNKFLVIISKGKLIDSNSSSNPDLVIWDNNKYTVVSSNPYANYGSGFYQMFCELFETLENA